MKFVAFLKPIECWDGLDWIYNLMEDRKTDYQFFLIEAKKAEIARDLAAEEFYKQDMKDGGISYIIGRAFDALCGFEYEEEQEVLDYFGEEDGKIVLEFFEKYGWEDMFNDKVTFGSYGEKKHFVREDRDKFYAFEPENLKKLYKRNIWYDILMMPISKEIKEPKKSRI